MIPSRRQFHLMALGLGAATLSGCGAKALNGGKKDTIVYGQNSEPTALNMAISTAAPAAFVVSKVFDGLLVFDLAGNPRPQLAESWDMSPDGLTFIFHLRQDVRWHDGKPFTSADVAYTLLEVWKKYHGRGITTFANVVAVDTPTPHIAILRLTKPAPYLLGCLAVTESCVLPKHLYAGTDPLSNPYNVAPIGNGPFRFVEWQRGNEIRLARNPDYWDAPKPHMEKIIVRFMPDATVTAVALEKGEIDLGGVPRSEVERLRANPKLTVRSNVASLAPGWSQFEFNLRRPYFQDVRVRQAFAYGIDRAFIARNILGNAIVADSPIPLELKDFHAGNLPRYEFDIARANALLDEAGLKRGPDGVRLRIHLDFTAGDDTRRTTASMRTTLAQAGIVVETRGQDQAEFINRLYTRRDFDTSLVGGTAGRDPAIGVQRYYWSKNIVKGVAFSNGTGYANPEVDRILEAAQVELDQEKRRSLYDQFQRIIMTELPNIPLFWTKGTIISSARVQNLVTDLGGLNGDFADVTLAY